jgi:ATP-dependent DNA helicase RecG
MADRLPINLDDLLRQRWVEGERIEYKAGWNPDAIIRTLCAFANDFENLGGGYMVIGQDCDANGQPQFSPVGLAVDQIDQIQHQLLAAGRAVSRRYRNRRIGEFLKELDLTEGRSTGVPKIFRTMAANGSPHPAV